MCRDAGSETTVFTILGLFTLTLHVAVSLRVKRLGEPFLTSTTSSFTNDSSVLFLATKSYLDLANSFG